MGNTYQYGAVRDLAIKNDSVFFLAYDRGFSSPGNSGVAMWTGKEWSRLETNIQWLGWGEYWNTGTIGLLAGTTGIIGSLALSGNTLYAGGHFNMIGGVPSSFIAQWDLEGGSGLVRNGSSKRFSGTEKLFLGNGSQGDLRFIIETHPGIRFFDARGRVLNSTH
jgi:hypothetical protein